jgi:acetyl/propionyl-CoA carboxylase alpha subunit
VLELDDPPRLPIELDVHPVAELVGGNDLGHRRLRVSNHHPFSHDRRLTPVVTVRDAMASDLPPSQPASHLAPMSPTAMTGV